MKFKCPECGEKMTVNEEAHVCECGKELSLTEANELFEDSQLIAYLDEEDSLEEGKKDKEDKDDDDGDDVEVNVDVDTDDDDDDDDEEKSDSDDDDDDKEEKGKVPSKPGKDEKVEEGVDPKAKSSKMKGNTVSDEKTPEGGDVEGKTKPKKAADPKGKGAKAEGAGTDDPEDGSGKKQVVPEGFDMSDAVAALTDGEELSEEYKEKASLIFETAVAARVKAEVDAATEVMETTYDEKLAEAKAKIEEELEVYLESIVDEWKAENAVALSANLQIESMQSFVDGLKDLFEQHYIEVPEGRYDVLEGLAAKVEELEAKLDEEVEKNISLSKEVKESKKQEIVAGIVEGLAETQKEKLLSLVEEVDESDLEKFETKVKSLKESFFGKKGSSEEKELNEEVLDDDVDADSVSKSGNDLIARAVAHLKTAR